MPVTLMSKKQTQGGPCAHGGKSIPTLSLSHLCDSIHQPPTQMRVYVYLHNWTLQSCRAPKEINITFVARWATGHRNVPIKINHLRLPAINAISWDTGQPYAPQSKGTEDQRLLLRLPKTEEAPPVGPKTTDPRHGLELRVQVAVARKSTFSYSISGPPVLS